MSLNNNFPPLRLFFTSPVSLHHPSCSLSSSPSCFPSHLAALQVSCLCLCFFFLAFIRTWGSRREKISISSSLSGGGFSHFSVFTEAWRVESAGNELEKAVLCPFFLFTRFMFVYLFCAVALAFVFYESAVVASTPEASWATLSHRAVTADSSRLRNNIIPPRCRRRHHEIIVCPLVSEQVNF